MTDLILYTIITWAVFLVPFGGLCFYVARSDHSEQTAFDKRNLYLYIWIATPLLLPLLVTVGILWYPVKWTLSALNAAGRPVFTYTEQAVDYARRLLVSAGG